MTLHALTVETRARRHIPPATRSSGTSPETPTPVDEQSANLSFDEALRCFRAQHIRAVRARDGVIEAAMLIDMRKEPARELDARYARTDVLEFAAWAAALHSFPSDADVIARFNVAKRTAQRWIRSYVRATATIGAPR